MKYTDFTIIFCCNSFVGMVTIFEYIFKEIKLDFISLQINTRHLCKYLWPKINQYKECYCLTTSTKKLQEENLLLIKIKIIEATQHIYIKKNYYLILIVNIMIKIIYCLIATVNIMMTKKTYYLMLIVTL